MLLTTGNIVKLTENDFYKSKKGIKHSLSKGKSIIFFGVPWCGYCKKALPEYIKAAQQLGKAFTLFYIDCETYPKVSELMGIKGYPTIMYMKDGIPYKMYNGERTRDGFLKDICKEAMKCM
jgi:thiol-disulfide isomerase/thioredoxin